MTQPTDRSSPRDKLPRREPEEIYNQEIENALSVPEIQQSLISDSRNSDINVKDLKEQCQLKRKDIFDDIARKQLREYANARSALRSASNISIIYRLATAPYLIRAAVIVSLGLSIFAFARSRPNDLVANTNERGLIISAVFSFLAFIIPALQRPTRAWALLRYRTLIDRVQAGLFSAAAVVFWVDILAIHNITPQHGNSQPSSGILIYVAWAAFVVIPPITFARVYDYDIPEKVRSNKKSSQKAALRLRIDGKSSLLTIVIFPVILLASLLAGSRHAVLATARPGPTVIVSALIAPCALIFASVGIRMQPIKVLEERARSAETALSAALRVKGLIPFIRQKINEYEPSFSKTLEIQDTSGLSEQFDPIFEVSTESKRRVDNVLGGMLTGGSIGIAGPRGAGKSTLLRSYCNRTRDSSDTSISILLSAPVEYSSRDFLLHMYAMLCREVLSRSKTNPNRTAPLKFGDRRRYAVGITSYGLLTVTAGASLIVLQPEGLRISNSQLWGVLIILLGLGFLLQIFIRHGLTGGTKFSESSSMEDRSLEEIAASRLEEIRYQQTISATWSGALKFPIAEGTLGGSNSLVRQTLMLPEIVDSMRTFMTVAARRGKVVIGIDELDKIESDERARQFVNEIKSVFGVKNCWFLVTVSEEAMGSFERRGVPFRDVFDSSFDEIVRVSFLNFRESGSVLNRRVIGMSDEFKALCFGLSGGLSRDLIRAARKICEVREDFGKKDLTFIADKVISTDLSGKSEAISAAMAAIDAEPQTSDTVGWVRSINLPSLSPDPMQDKFSELEHVSYTALDAEAVNQEKLQVLRRLAAEFAGYCYYLETLREVIFSIQSSEVEGYRLNGDPPFNLLVTGRQLFTVNTVVAWDFISQYRRACGMKVIEIPESLRRVSPTNK